MLNYMYKMREFPYQTGNSPISVALMLASMQNTLSIMTSRSRRWIVFIFRLPLFLLAGTATPTCPVSTGGAGALREWIGQELVDVRSAW